MNMYNNYQNNGTSYYGNGGLQYPSQQQSLLTVFINSEDEAINYPVAAGVTVLLISFNLGKFYLKSTETDGIPKPLRMFEFTEKKVVNVTHDNGDYVTKEDFNNLSKKLNSLIEKLGGDN